MSTVIALCAFKPGEVYDVCAEQTLPRYREVLLYPQQIDGWPGGSGTEGLPGDLASEGMVLQVEKSGGALDVGER